MWEYHTHKAQRSMIIMSSDVCNNIESNTFNVYFLTLKTRVHIDIIGF